MPNKQKPIQNTKQIVIKYLSSEVSFPASYYVLVSYIVSTKKSRAKSMKQFSYHKYFNAYWIAKREKSRLAKQGRKYAFPTTEKQKENQSRLVRAGFFPRFAQVTPNGIGWKSDWFIALFAPVVIGRRNRPVPSSLSLSFKASLSAKRLIMVIGYNFNFNGSLTLKT